MTTGMLSVTVSAIGKPGWPFVLVGSEEVCLRAYDSLGLAISRYRRTLMTAVRRPPLWALRLDQLRQDLTVREHAALSVLATVHAATTGQVARIIFDGDESANRLAHRHLSRLNYFGLVRRFRDRSRDRKVGARGYIHALTAAGLRMTGGTHAIGVRQRAAWRPSSDFLSHRLAISELYTRLIEQQHRGGPEVGEFKAEPDCRRWFSGPAGEQLVISPDALARLEIGELEVSWFVEVDLATETRPSTIAAKCQAYRRYELSGTEQRRYGVFPGVVFIVPDTARYRTISRIIARLPFDARSLFVVATQADALTAMAQVEVTP
jgi:hypothetical protein